MWTSAGPLPRPLQGDALSSQLLVAPLKLGAGLREFLLKLWLVYKYFICLSNLSVIDPDVREKAVNKQASKASGNEPKPSKKSLVESPSCVDPNFNLVGVRMRALWRGLGVSTFPWGRVMDTRETESSLPIYDPKVEGR
ncbi:hypothetical protein CRG98_005073 [Punica granatum]|uniref:Uncharacterized protein n=1 Tax=Punica granatum TaxID=22663 RepID=A0A2I0L1E5_PUNGR|nr:hypothetical protein CRG98_005073 [Punica granatum]